jgi:hypothetical protein
LKPHEAVAGQDDPVRPARDDVEQVAAGDHEPAAGVLDEAADPSPARHEHLDLPGAVREHPAPADVAEQVPPEGVRPRALEERVLALEHRLQVGEQHGLLDEGEAARVPLAAADLGDGARPADDVGGEVVVPAQERRADPVGVDGRPDALELADAVGGEAARDDDLHPLVAGRVEGPRVFSTSRGSRRSA